ncbi:quinoprotein glucose dehydrogenase [Bacillus sp. LL01]|uniref:PQQ-dependent sugar dehydrogenase n=1 Tax=Bacillus sp. LL01 TaxID=1665556 RepID=UPI00064CF91A|nr:PQQ-dependent sugar dehydrogenase [Bacillus sp. LL01]KMJ59554.1 quinoprotein glucose dehydrogenase [Bacillus sp. LL01]
MINKLLLTSLIPFLFLTSCNLGEQQDRGKGNESKETTTLPEKEVQQPRYSVKNKEVFATNLNVPWSITQNRDAFYITERTGHIVKVQDRGLKREDVDLSEQLLVYGEGGLLGLELHPDFETNGQAFAYHTYGTEQEVKNRIVLLKYHENKWVEEDVLLEDIEGAIFHNGGRLKIGPDNKLYATVGDANKPDSAQNKEVLTGSILRLNLDGSVPEDNPYPDSYVYSYGHRNPQGLAWNMESGEMYASEHGPSAYDEINRIEKGKNYGWPEITGDKLSEGMEAPLFHSETDTWAPSGIAFEKEKLFVASLRGEMVREFELNTGQQSILWNENGRIRDILLDGNYLYIISNNKDGRGTPGPDDDQLIRLELTTD